MANMGNVLTRFDNCGLLGALIGELDYQAYGPSEDDLLGEAARHEGAIRDQITAREAECAKLDARINTLKSEAINLKSRCAMRTITPDGRAQALQRLKRVMQTLAMTQQQLQTQRTFVEQGHATLQKIAAASRVRQDTQYVVQLNSATEFAKMRTGDAELAQMGEATDQLLENDGALDAAHDAVRDSAAQLQRAMDTQPMPDMDQMSFSLNDEKDLLAAVAVFEEEITLSQPTATAASVYKGANSTDPTIAAVSASSSSMMYAMPSAPIAEPMRGTPRVAVAMTTSGASVGVRRGDGGGARARRDKNNNLDDVF